MQFNDEAPLGAEFQQDSLAYMQNYVQNMNNQMFLSEYHLNHLYALLLLSRGAPWDAVKPDSPSFKKDIDEVIERKINEVKLLLQNLSQMYEDQIKKGTLNHLEKLVGILRAKNKSVYIQRIQQSCQGRKRSSQNGRGLIERRDNTELNPQIRHNTDKANNPYKFQAESNYNEQIKSEQHGYQEQIQENIYSTKTVQVYEGESNQQYNSNQEEANQLLQQGLRKFNNSPQMQQREPQADNEVIALFVGLANINNIAAMALSVGDLLEFNSPERSIRFKFSKNYAITIKNEDPFHFDGNSKLREIPSDMFVSHIFPFLTAPELFRVRAVSKQWMQDVKQAWHGTFKREMFVQLLACEFCKEIQFYYKLIQLRNPFFRKMSLLLHALIEIIQWETVLQSIQTNNLSTQMKRLLIILLKLIGEPIPFRTLNDIDENLWNIHRQKTLTIKDHVTQFFTNVNAKSNLSIEELRNMKMGLLDNPFMRMEGMNTQDKTPLLLSIFVKQLTLHQILRGHIKSSQQYLLNSKKRLDDISLKRPQQRGFLQGVYRILLFANVRAQREEEQQKISMPDFHYILQSAFRSQQANKPDFVIKGKKSETNFFIDNPTKLDIILSTIKSMDLQKSQQQSVEQPKLDFQKNKSQPTERQEQELEKRQDVENQQKKGILSPKKDEKNNQERKVHQQNLQRG